MHLFKVEKNVNLEELENSLVNGFHDGYLRGIEISFSGTVVLLATLLVSYADEPERFQDACIRLTGVKTIVIEGPKTPHNWEDEVWLDGYKTTEEQLPAFRDFPLDVQKLCYSLHLRDNNWRSSIHIAASGAEIVWGAVVDRAAK